MFEYILLGTVIAGIVELITRLRAKDYWTVLTICSSVLVGALFGYFGVEGLNVATGIAAGLGASGAIAALHSGSQRSDTHSGIVSH